MAGETEYEFLDRAERAELLGRQQHLLEQEHYVNSLNLRAAQALGDLDGAQEQIDLAQTNLTVIERKLAFVREERARLGEGRDGAAD